MPPSPPSEDGQAIKGGARMVEVVFQGEEFMLNQWIMDNAQCIMFE